MRAWTSADRLSARGLTCLFILLCLGGAYAQMPQPGMGIPGYPKGPAPRPGLQAAGPQDVANQATVAVLLFKIRSAFSLTPPMVASLQNKGSDDEATIPSPSTGAPGSSKANSAPADKASAIKWSEVLVREVPFSVPLDVRLVGKNVLALVQLVPIETGAEEINLLVQGQVWVQKADGTLSFKSSFQSLNLALGSRIYFYPLGVDGKNGAPIAVEIKVDRP